MAKIVFIQDGIVEEVAYWDGSPFTNPPGRTIVIVSDLHGVKAGWLFNPSTNTFYATAQQNGTSRVEKIDFFRLFTLEERARYNAIRKQVRLMAPQDYASSDPTKQLLVALDIVFDAFDLVALVELNHPETIQGVHLLATAGMFGDDPDVRSTRITQVLAGQLPA